MLRRRAPTVPGRARTRRAAGVRPRPRPAPARIGTAVPVLGAGRSPRGPATTWSPSCAAARPRSPSCAASRRGAQHRRGRGLRVRPRRPGGSAGRGAHRRGVAVTVIADPSESATAATALTLRAAGIDVVDYPVRARMIDHVKLLVVDGVGGGRRGHQLGRGLVRQPRLRRRGARAGRRQPRPRLHPRPGHLRARASCPRRVPDPAVLVGGHAARRGDPPDGARRDRGGATQPRRRHVHAHRRGRGRRHGGGPGARRLGARAARPQRAAERPVGRVAARARRRRAAVPQQRREAARQGRDRRRLDGGARQRQLDGQRLRAQPRARRGHPRQPGAWPPPSRSSTSATGRRAPDAAAPQNRLRPVISSRHRQPHRGQHGGRDVGEAAARAQGLRIRAAEDHRHGAGGVRGERRVVARVDLLLGVAVVGGDQQAAARFVTAASIRSRQASTTSTARTVASNTPVCPTMSGLAKLTTMRASRRRARRAPRRRR